MQCFDRATLEEELRSTGLQVVRCLGSVAGDPFDEGAEEFAVVAKPIGDPAGPRRQD